MIGRLLQDFLQDRLCFSVFALVKQKLSFVEIVHARRIAHH
jgi:hypothetical protein